LVGGGAGLGYCGGEREGQQISAAVGTRQAMVVTDDSGGFLDAVFNTGANA